jgi:hypothetical protein
LGQLVAIAVNYSAKSQVKEAGNQQGQAKHHYDGEPASKRTQHVFEGNI